MGCTCKQCTLHVVCHSKQCVMQITGNINYNVNTCNIAAADHMYVEYKVATCSITYIHCTGQLSKSDFSVHHGYRWFWLGQIIQEVKGT